MFEGRRRINPDCSGAMLFEPNYFIFLRTARHPCPDSVRVQGDRGESIPRVPGRPGGAVHPGHGASGPAQAAQSRRVPLATSSSRPVKMEEKKRGKPVFEKCGKSRFVKKKRGKPVFEKCGKSRFVKKKRGKPVFEKCGKSEIFEKKRGKKDFLMKTAVTKQAVLYL